MRIKNRIFVGAFVFAFSAYLLLPAFTPKVSAATFASQGQIDNFAKTLNFSDAGTIVGQFNGQTIVFKKTNDLAACGGGFIARCYEATNLFCSNNTASIKLLTSVGAIGMQDPPGTWTLDAPYQQGPGGTCIDSSVKLDLSKSQAQAGGLASRVNKTTLQTNVRVGDIGDNERFTSTTATPNTYFRDSEKGEECIDRIVVSGDDKATIFELQKSNEGHSGTDIDNPSIGDCRILSINGTSTREDTDDKAVKALSKTTFAVANFTNADGTLGDDAVDDDANCDNTGSGPLGWILCPVFDATVGFTGFVFDSFIVPFLQDVPVSTNPEEGTYKAWNQFRILGNIILVLSMLGVVYSQARSDK